MQCLLNVRLGACSAGGFRRLEVSRIISDKNVVRWGGL